MAFEPRVVVLQADRFGPDESELVTVRVSVEVESSPSLIAPSVVEIESPPVIVVVTVVASEAASDSVPVLVETSVSSPLTYAPPVPDVSDELSESVAVSVPVAVELLVASSTPESVSLEVAPPSAEELY